MRATEEKQLLKEAVQAFEAETGLKIEITRYHYIENRREIDGMVNLPCQAGRLAVEVKKWAQHTNIGAIANQIANLPMEGMLVADYVNPNMAEKLRELGIPFIDTAGNAYIHKPPLYIWVTARKPEMQRKKRGERGGRAFDATGLKVVYGLLCQPDLAGAPYRQIAEQTDVALGTVGWVINDLKAAGFLVERGKTKGRRLTERKKLLDRWVEAYPEKLKPKLKVGDFIANDPLWWKKLDIEKYGAYWGGEIAAAKYTNYLKPKVATIYLPEAAGNKLLADAKLRKAVNQDADGYLVKIYRPFWQVVPKNEKTTPSVVHPILTYADLIATGDSRNLETARMVYEQYIAEHLGED